MHHQLDRLRDDATAALAEDDTIATGRSDTEAARVLDEFFLDYFDGRDPSPEFAEALVVLATRETWPEAPAGAAAASARTAVSDAAATVRELLASAGTSDRDVDTRAETVLQLPSHVIDLLLDRPAATLLHEDPLAVAALAEAVAVPLEHVLQAVAASARMATGSTYGYVPRLSPDANTGATDRREATRASLLDWGARLLAARPAGTA